MARLAASEVAEVVERILTLRPWVRPIAGIAAPPAIVGFARQQLGDVRVHEQGWIATAQSDGIAVTSTPRLGVLAQPAVIPWGDIASSLRPDLTRSQLGLSSAPEVRQPGLF